MELYRKITTQPSILLGNADIKMEILAESAATNKLSLQKFISFSYTYFFIGANTY